MFHTVGYKTGFVQYSTIDGKEKIYAQFWRNGNLESEKANSESHAKRIITLRSTDTDSSLKFRDLAIGDTFTMNGSNFDLGKVYRKTGKLSYRQSNGEGLSYKVGSINAKVAKA